MTDDEFRIVVDGTGERTGMVASDPMGHDAALKGFDNVWPAFESDIVAGDIRVSVLSETEFQRRP